MKNSSSYRIDCTPSINLILLSRIVKCILSNLKDKERKRIEVMEKVGRAVVLGARARWQMSRSGQYSLCLKRTLIVSSSSSSSWLLKKKEDSLFSYPSSPCLLFQRRGAKVLGTDVRTGNVINRKGRIFQVLKAQHTQHGRGGATIQVELRDVDSGNKLTERLRTDEPVESVHVEEKSFTFLYSDGDTLVLTDPETYEQAEVPKDLFGRTAVYLKEDMTVKIYYYDGRPMSVTLPYRVTCTVVEAQPPKKGMSINPQRFKKVLLDNGLTVMAPPFIVTGDKIVVNTDDDSYFTREK